MKTISIWLAFGLLLTVSCRGQAKHAPPQHDGVVAPVLEVKNPDESGIIYFSKDNGASWSNRSKGIPENVFLTDISFSDTLLGVASKQHGIYFYNLLSEEWRPFRLSKPAASDMDALLIFNGKIYAGTQGEGVFVADIQDGTWKNINTGLKNLTVRRLAQKGNTIYAGTNGGLYAMNAHEPVWKKEFGDASLQINGITFHDDAIYIGTNRGAYTSTLQHSDWKLVLPDRSLHNISNAGDAIYAMVYSELWISKDKGESWQSDQKGMPVGMYSFQVIESGGQVFDGQWDGIYRKDPELNWVKINGGLPDNIPITEMKYHNGILVAASSQWFKKK